jgi:K+-sensing histidine kinase KdpD
MGFNSKKSFDKFEAHIDQAIVDMNNIVERCVMADKFDGKSLNTINESCNVYQAIQDIAGIYKNRAEILIHGDQDHFVNSDAHLLRTILVNLIDNAVKYGKEGSPVEISLSQKVIDDSECEVVSISNIPGLAGMPDPSKVFSKYYRAPRAYEKTGSGLGLYLIGNIANAIGAQLDYVEDALKVIFVLQIPLKGVKISNKL